MQERLGGRVFTAVSAIQHDRLNRQDELQAEQGYYEGLLNVGSYTSALWRIGTVPEDWTTLLESGATTLTGDLCEYELIPDLNIVFKRAEFRTNSWGMRDRDYAWEKAPGTYRIALLGASHTMGSGVDNDETFENLLEDRLNEAPPSRRYSAYEILNFAVGGHGLLSQVALAEKRAFAFKPDAVFHVVHPDDMRGRTALRLAKTMAEGYRIEEDALADAALRELIQQADISAGMTAKEIERRLSPISGVMTEWALAKLASLCERHGALPVIVLMATLAQEFEAQEHEDLLRLGEALGFTLVDLSRVYEGYEPASLQLTKWDNHPGPRAHRIIAERLYGALLDNRQALGLDPGLELDILTHLPESP